MPLAVLAAGGEYRILLGLHVELDGIDVVGGALSLFLFLGLKGGGAALGSFLSREKIRIDGCHGGEILLYGLLFVGKGDLLHRLGDLALFNEDIGTVNIDWSTTDQAEGVVTAVGTFKNKTLTTADNAYVLPGNITSTGALTFNKANGANIRPFRAYITVPGGGAKINVLFDDTTGIHAATVEQLEAIFNIYSIDGKLVRQNSDSKVGLEKGIYIINGKKVIVK